MRLKPTITALSRFRWAIRAEAANALMGVLSEARVRSDDDYDEMMDDPEMDRPKQRMAAGTAIIPIRGVIAPRANMLTQTSGMTSTDQIGEWFDQALGDPNVSRIVFDVDSPGGQEQGIPELAQKIFSARGKKPMTAVANFEMGSGALWLSLAADRVVASPSAEVGSVGVYTIHVDQSAMNEAVGLKYTLISAGPFKVEGNPYQPLSDDGMAYHQSLVNNSYSRFVGDLARFRSKSAETVAGSFGGGRMLASESALAVGMIDGIETFESVMSGTVRPREAVDSGYYRSRRTRTWEALIPSQA